MFDDDRSLAALAGGVGAGLGAVVPIAVQMDGLVAVATALAAGAMAAGLLVVLLNRW